MNVGDQIRQQIRERLDELGWSGRELARRAGLHKMAVSNILRGRKRLAVDDPDFVAMLETLGFHMRVHLDVQPQMDAEREELLAELSDVLPLLEAGDVSHLRFLVGMLVNRIK